LATNWQWICRVELNVVIAWSSREHTIEALK
jgi:hypothetical protein